MDITNKLIKKIDEARYLTADNAWRYRTILRFFYYQYEKMRYFMYKEDILEELKKESLFQEYTIDQCKQDLDVLVEWGNLIPVQDTSKVATIEEFKNKQFRYQMSDYSVEIERMTIRLENLHVESASLEPTLLERIRLDLERLPKLPKEDEKVIGLWWNSLNIDFKRLNQNYQDYIRDLYSLKAEELMKTKEFLVFKDKFIDYLRDFIKSLQNNSYAIESLLRGIDIETEEMLLSKVLQYEQSIPRLDAEVNLQAIKDNIYGRWYSLKGWFLGYPGRESESSRLFDITNEIIRKITRFAFQITETLNIAANRKEEYRQLSNIFDGCKDIEQAHKLSSLVFGIFNTKHIKADMERKTESLNSGVYDEEPHVIKIKPRIRNYREKSQRTAVSSKRDEKKKLMMDIIKKREEELRLIEEYIKDGKLDFGKLPVINGKVRITLLRWLSKGLSSSSKTAKTEDGRSFIIDQSLRDKRCIVKCEDGDFEMPYYIMKFKQGEE